ncbi:MAG: chromosome segregation protein SMC [Firmicutes bacterium]|nr:chromosome segregation protein SMC [Bacillota bacterium]
MYLKSLEVTGFKSFPEKTVLKFSPGITAVVGPNGCGKSNLLDAVRFALGEQSVKLLRGGRMDDFIFNGTARRKALNFAEVTLVFDRADRYLPLEYQEVAVTRRLYRTGEGEYFLNKHSCRLKDITELFLDTGIGTETYSLIGQGRVERLINARPEERRELFAEAAGIHKYKQRKKEASYKLGEMKGNLLRVTDLLAELESQSVILSKAAARAKEYKALYGKLQNLEKKIYLQRWAAKASQLQKIESNRQKTGIHLTEQKNKLKKLDEEKRLIADRENRAVRKLEEYRDLYRGKEGSSAQLQNKLNLMQEQKKHIQEKSAAQAAACQEVKERLAGLERTLQKDREELQKIRREQEQLGKKAAAFKAERQALQGGQDLVYLKELRACRAEKDLRAATLRQLLKSLGQRGDELCAGLENIRRQEEQKKSAREGLQKTKDELRAALEKIKGEQADWEQDCRLGEQRCADLRLQKKELQEQLQKIEKEQQIKSARLKYLQESEEYFSLYSRGVQAVMQAAAKNMLSGILGPAANLIGVPAELEKAVETALGAKLQFIIVESDVSAREAINFLKKNKAGKATFLPLDLLRVTAKKAPGFLAGEFLGVASELVEAAPRCKKVVDYLLGYILVAGNLEAALKLARNNRAGWRIVTLDGEMITPGGAISGGYQPRERSGFLERKRELKGLEKDIIALKKQIEQQNGDLQALAGNLKKFTSFLAETNQRLRVAAEETIKVNSALQRITAEKNRVAQECAALEQEKNMLRAQHSEFVTKQNAVKKEYTALKESLAAIKVELENVGSKVHAAEEQFKKVERELVEIRIRFAALQEKESSLQEIILKQVREKEHLQELVASLEQEETRLQEELQETGIQESELQNTLEHEKRALQKLKELRAQQQNILQLCHREKEELGQILVREQKLLEKHERRTRGLDAEQIRLEEAGRYLEENLRERFMFNPEEDVLPREQAVIPEEDLLQEKELVEKELARMGAVNPGAVEEFAQLQKRIKFLAEQRADLLAGEKGMQKLIAELDEYMEEQFLQALQGIGDHFADVFIKLFNGGQAFLKLSDTENVLAAEIEINAQPPGKKMQNISLLSGGEKALTAVALLFALLKHKPVPFCILDEIESSLDENNLAKFVNFLRKYDGGTQFIMITHRRRTMEEADFLYGVTMEEQGISKVVSLNLVEKVG